MFFDDPVRAFANLRRAATATSAELQVIAWRSAADNPFMTTAERAAAPFLPAFPRVVPDGPGQFAFADRQRVDAVLRESDWSDVDIQPIDVICTFPERALGSTSPGWVRSGLVLQEADEQTRRQVFDTVRAAFDRYVHGADVRFTAACWMIGARARVAPRVP